MCGLNHLSLFLSTLFWPMNMVSIYFRTCSILFYFIFFYTFIFHTFFLFQKIINSHFLIIFPQTNRCTTRSACSSPLNKPTNRWISMDAQKCIDFQLITPDSLPIQSNSTVSFCLFYFFFFCFLFLYIGQFVVIHYCLWKKQIFIVQNILYSLSNVLT